MSDIFNVGQIKVETVDRKIKRTVSIELHSVESAKYRVQRHSLKILHPSLGGLEPPTFRLTAERANRLRHRDLAVTRETVTEVTRNYLH